ncbi:hypothetical protein [Pararhizobium sp. A13]|uniref:hypothetical protein n=1 Tax=Pararhizobium sp. A13 TaxID=3133975 RepID=UPI00311AD8CE
MSSAHDGKAVACGPRPVRWRRVAIAIAAAGVLLFAGANAHLVYVAVASQPDCVLPANGSGETVKFQAAQPAC